jgi:3',5'-cyclic-AMP phosphodiesterase
MRSTRRPFLRMLAAAGACGPWLAARPSSAPRRIVFYTDLHTRTEFGTPEALALAAEKIRALKPDLILCGGDLVTDGFTTGAAAMLPRWDAYFEMHRSLGQEVHACLGNHDLVGVAPEDGSAPEADPRKEFRTRLGLDRTYYSFDALGLRFLVLDSLDVTMGNAAGKELYRGFIGAEQMEWLKRTPADTPRDRGLVLVSHIPLRIASTDLMEKMYKSPVPSPGRIVVNAAEVMALFAGRPLRAVLQGHLHFNEHTVKDGVPHIIGGAVCAKYWRGAWHGTEEGFGLLTLDGDRHGWEYMDMGWTARRP